MIDLFQIGADGRRSQIYLAMSTAADFRDHLSTFSDYYASLGEICDFLSSHTYPSSLYFRFWIAKAITNFCLILAWSTKCRHFQIWYPIHRLWWLWCRQRKKDNKEGNDNLFMSSKDDISVDREWIEHCIVSNNTNKKHTFSVSSTGNIEQRGSSLVNDRNETVDCNYEAIYFLW